MERLDFRRTSNTALVAELRHHAGLDEAGELGQHGARPGFGEPDPWGRLAAHARITLERLSLRHGAARLPGGERA